MELIIPDPYWPSEHVVIFGQLGFVIIAHEDHVYIDVGLVCSPRAKQDYRAWKRAVNKGHIDRQRKKRAALRALSANA